MNPIATDVLQKAERNNYWGDITLVYRDGQVVLIRKLETLTVKGEGEPRNGEHRK